MNDGILRLEPNCQPEEIIGSIDCAALLHDTARIVDPEMKQVLTLSNGTVVQDEGNCFSHWTANSMCRNCVSMRSYQSGKAMMKLEYNKNHVEMITAVPVYLGTRLVVVEMLKDVTDSMFFNSQSQEDGDMLKGIINSVSDIAVRDSLTGVYNRRFITEQLPEEVRLCREPGKSLSVIMMDIDNFKSINDTWGHVAGDIVLKTFAGLIGGCLRKNEDWLARYGGDEFMALLWDTGSGEAGQIAERMRVLVEKTPVACGEVSISITASLGVYTVNPGDPLVTDILKNADDRLYHAKQSGRNRVSQ